MNLNQIENAMTFTDPLPAEETLDRMEGLFKMRRLLRASVANKIEILKRYGAMVPPPLPGHTMRIVNEKTQSERRLAGTISEIVEVARLIVAEADNGDLIREAEEAVMVKREGKCDVVYGWDV